MIIFTAIHCILFAGILFCLDQIRKKMLHIEFLIQQQDHFWETKFSEMEELIKDVKFQTKAHGAILDMLNNKLNELSLNKKT